MGQPGASLIKVNAVTNTLAVLQTGRRQVVAVRVIATGAVTGDQYLQLFDAAATTGLTLGTSKPDWVVMIDGGTGEVSEGDGLPTHGLIFTNGIVGAVTASAEGNGAATPTTADVRIAVI